MVAKAKPKAKPKVKAKAKGEAVKPVPVLLSGKEKRALRRLQRLEYYHQVARDRQARRRVR